MICPQLVFRNASSAGKIKKASLILALLMGSYISNEVRATSIHGINSRNSVMASKSTAASGSFSNSAVWNPSGVPLWGENVTVNHALTLDAPLDINAVYVFNKDITDPIGGAEYSMKISNNGSLVINSQVVLNGGLTLANNAVLTIKNGAKLTIGPATFNNSSVINIEAGGMLVIYGDIIAGNSVTINCNGLIDINGSYRSSNTVQILGDGDITTTGVLVSSNTSKTFGSTDDCNSGPCSGRNLCAFTNTISTPTPTICTGTSPTAIAGITNASSPTILWEKSTTTFSTGYSTVTGVSNSSGFEPGEMTQSTWYRRTLTKSGCTSKAVQLITVVQNPVIVTQPVNATVCHGSNAMFTVLATGSALQYSWEVNTGNSWSKISLTSGLYSNCNTSTLTVNAPTIAMNNYQYRCNVSNSCAPSATTNSVSLSLNSAGSWIGANGNWSSATNWCGGLPSISNDIEISSGTVIIDLVSAKCRNIIISGTGQLVLNNPNTLSVYGNWTGSNNFTQTGGTIILNGASSQTINGNNSFKNLTIANTSGGVVIPSGSNKQKITGNLTLTSGILTSNENLSIDFTNGGAIAGTGSGSIIGNVNTTRTIGSGWHYIGVPTDGLTYNDLNSTLPINGNNFYTYQESINNKDISAGWSSRGEGLNTLLREKKDDGGPSDMIGYAISFPSTVEMSLSGTYTHGKSYETGNISYVNSGMGSSDGWHLVSNPYPSYIDWNSTSGWTKTNINGPITYYDAFKGKNIDYIPAANGFPEVALNGGSPFIPPMQAFWIQTNAEGASLKISNGARITNPSTSVYGASVFYRKSSSTAKSLKIMVMGNDRFDETMLRFGNGGTEDFDVNLDGFKFKNDLPTPNIYTIDHVAEYSVNTLPLTSFQNKINLNFEPGSNGQFTISVKDLKNIDPIVILVLEDKVLNVFHNLSKNPEYTFAAEAGNVASRFVISFETLSTLESITSSSNSSNTTNIVKPGNTETITANVSTEGTDKASIDIVANQHDIKIHFYNHISGNAEINIYNMSGQEIYNAHHADISGGMIDIKLHHIHTGMYIVKVSSGKVTHSEKIHL